MMRFIIVAETGPDRCIVRSTDTFKEAVTEWKTLMNAGHPTVYIAETIPLIISDDRPYQRQPQNVRIVSPEGPAMRKDDSSF